MKLRSTKIKLLFLVIQGVLLFQSPTFAQTFRTFNKLVVFDAERKRLSVEYLNVAAQFLVDRDGMIFRQLPETAFARHMIGLNYCAIGVENVGAAMHH